jgi:hypothetical protein
MLLAEGDMRTEKKSGFKIQIPFAPLKFQTFLTVRNKLRAATITPLYCHCRVLSMLVETMRVASWETCPETRAST